MMGVVLCDVCLEQTGGRSLVPGPCHQGGENLCATHLNTIRSEMVCPDCAAESAGTFTSIGLPGVEYECPICGDDWWVSSRAGVDTPSPTEVLGRRRGLFEALGRGMLTDRYGAAGLIRSRRPYTTRN